MMHGNCHKCAACIAQKRSEWTFRLLQEMKIATSAYFLTLTYSDEHVPKDLNLSKEELQNFFKRLRVAQSKVTKSQIRYYAIGEYGENTHRPHYHIILFNVHNDVKPNLETIWKKGFIQLKPVNQARLHYVTKHQVVTMLELQEKEPPFSLMSKRPYLGYSYVNKATKKYHKANPHYVSFHSGHKIPMPRVYKKHFFTKIQRQINAAEAIRLSVENENNLQAKYEKKGVNYFTRYSEIQKQKIKNQKRTSKSRKL